MANTTIYVPDIGGAEGAEVVELLVAVGDTIELEQSLIVLESDKASMEIPATCAGTVLEIRTAVGDQLSEGDAIVVVETAVGVDESEQGSAPASAVAAAASELAEASSSAPAEQDQASAARESAELAGASGGAGSHAMTVTIPDIGTDGDVDLIEICVEVGQLVEEGESLVVLESDKASMEVPAPATGKVTGLLVNAGAQVRQGTAIVELEVAGGSTKSNSESAGQVAQTSTSDIAPKAVENSAQVVADPSHKGATVSPATQSHAAGLQGVPGPSNESVYAGPAVRKMAREFGVDLGRVSGSGPRGRIVKEDLHSFVKTALAASTAGANEAGSIGAGIPPIPEVDFAKFGEIDPQARTRLDKVTASNMSRSWLNVPHVTQFDDADITDLEAFRAEMKAEAERRKTKLTPMPFIVKACAAALNAHPKLKSSLADGGETLVYKQYCHIGMAVDTPSGLVVPVIRDVDQKSIWELSEEILALAGMARDKKLRPDHMQGGVFTISSLGNIGGRGFTPIVNAPEVAILGISRADIQPVWNGKEFVPRKMLPVALSYDHRVINGGDAGRFLTDLCGLLGDIRKILM